MKVIVQDRFGPPEVLELREVDEPEVGEGEVLVRVRAASVNPADWYAMTGVPYVARPQMGLRKPRHNRVGLDLAGVVAAVGGNAGRFRLGDEVFGASTGTLAEYVTADSAAPGTWTWSVRSAPTGSSTTPRRRAARTCWSCGSCSRPER